MIPAAVLLALFLITCIPNCIIAQRTYDKIFEAWTMGGIMIDGVY